MERLSKKHVQDIMALTPMQEGMLFHYLHTVKNDHYFEQLCLHISGNIDVNYVERAWQVVIANNEMLRTIFRWEKVEEPVQLILNEHNFHLEYYDLSGIEINRKHEELEQIKVQDRNKGFDLSEIPFRVTLVKILETSYVMMISNHHILYDGWSNGIILREFFQAYESLKGVEKPVNEIPVKPGFKEFIQWIQQQDKNQQESYWKLYLKDFAFQTGFSWKRKLRVDSRVTGVENYRISLQDGWRSKLEAFVKDHKITIASLLYSSWGVLLQIYHNSDDVVFGTTVSGRTARIKGIENMVGLFINTIPFRFHTPFNLRVKDLITIINNEEQRRGEFESTSLVDINKWCKPDVNHEFFDSILVIENYPLDVRLMSVSGKKGISVQSYSAFHMTNYDLTVEIELSGDIRFNFIYDPRWFDEKTIHALAGYFRNVIEEFILYPEKRLFEVDILSESEKTRIIKDLNAGYFQNVEEKTLVELFEGQVERVADYTALVGPKLLDTADIEKKEIGDNIFITYNELGQRSGQLAHLLRKRGVYPDIIVGIMMERSIDMIIGLFGILKAGGAYLPIDPGYPPERVELMLKDSNVNILLKVDKIVDLGGECSSFQRYFHILSAANLAYIIYTSGTTGKPKGTLVEHRNITALMQIGRALFTYNEADVWTMFHSYCFDFSVWEMFGALLFGGRLVLIPGIITRDPRKYLEILRKEKVTILNQTPALFYHLVEEEKQISAKELSLRFVIFGGEALSPGKLKPWKEKYPATHLINMYGITETTVHVTFKEITQEEIEHNISNIGKPISSLFVFITDQHSRIVPEGVPGELWVGGQGVCRGYLNRPALTTAKFRLQRPGGSFYKNRPLDPRKNVLLTVPRTANQKLLRGVQGGGFLEKNPPGRRRQKNYRTGDLVRSIENGEIEYLGRIDHQVKIRGNRVEPGEIERQLMRLETITEAVVIAHEDENREKYLCAYLKIEQDRQMNISEIREVLSKTLPGYMIPDYFICLEKIPVTSTGKVNRSQLPLPTGHRPILGSTYAPPETEMARAIAGIWQDILKLDKVGIHDNFFDLGGNSLVIIRLKSRLQELLKKEIQVISLFQYPTIHTFTRYMTQSQQRITIGGSDKEEEPDFTAKLQQGKAKLKDRRKKISNKGV